MNPRESNSMCKSFDLTIDALANLSQHLCSEDFPKQDKVMEEMLYAVRNMQRKIYGEYQEAIDAQEKKERARLYVKKHATKEAARYQSSFFNRVNT